MSGIINDLTKYNNIIAVIDPETLSAISDIFLSPPGADKYITLKERLIAEFTDSENKQIHKLLSELQLGDDKPSHFLRKMQNLTGSSLTDNFLKTLWLQRLPSEIQTILSVSSEPLENLAKLADKIAEVRTDPLLMFAQWGIKPHFQISFSDSKFGQEAKKCKPPCSFNNNNNQEN